MCGGAWTAVSGAAGQAGAGNRLPHARPVDGYSAGRSSPPRHRCHSLDGGKRAGRQRAAAADSASHPLSRRDSPAFFLAYRDIVPALRSKKSVPLALKRFFDDLPFRSPAARLKGKPFISPVRSSFP